MRILIEGYYYDPKTLKKENIPEWLPEYHRNKDGKICYNYVGHVYDPEINDYIFFLPKVILSEKDKNDESKDKVFGSDPHEIITIDEDNESLDPEKRRFISNFSVWVYRALKVFRDDPKHEESGIILEHNIASVGRNIDTRLANTLLDVILELIAFNHENRDFVMFTLRNIHSGHNKINWTKTISKSQTIIQNGTPVYLDPVNKKRQINFDEELFIIYYSILNYVHRHFGFEVQMNVNFELISEEMFENMLDGMGSAKLMRIKYKYFSDKALRLWNLCYAFFELAHPVDVHENQKEYLLAQNFNVVFEAIIDKLIGSDDLPSGLKDQKDGKRVDHMFTYDGLMYPDALQQELSQQMYYIGDSKYYKIGAEVGDNSVYKQFTYARNVIQWNINLWLSDDEAKKKEENKEGIWLRDEVTEGYNIIPNFFISATIDDDLDYDRDKLSPKDSRFDNIQFENRLFDRDTMLISHYNVNFLYVLSLYGRDDESAQASWKNAVRKKFRERVQKTLTEKYEFYAMTPHEDINAAAYIQEHFQQMLGKIFTPYDNLGIKNYYSLALNKEERFSDDNEALLVQLKQAFYVEKCKSMDDNPEKLLEPVVGTAGRLPESNKFLTLHYLEKYQQQMILVGGYIGEEHLQWITGKNDRGSLIYNVRLGNVKGGQVKAQLDKKVVCFALLYDFSDITKFKVFHVHHHATMTKERLKKTGYKLDTHAEKYFCYVFDEEVTLGDIDITKLLSEHKSSKAPVFVSGEEMMKYRK